MNQYINMVWNIQLEFSFFFCFAYLLLLLLDGTIVPELLSVLGSYQAGPIKLLTQLGPEVDNTENTVIVQF